MRAVIPTALLALGALAAADRTLVPGAVESPATLIRCNGTSVVPGRDRVLVEVDESFMVPPGRTLIIEGLNCSNASNSITFTLIDTPNPNRPVTFSVGTGAGLRSFDGDYPILEGQGVSLASASTGSALWGYLIDN